MHRLGRAFLIFATFGALNQASAQAPVPDEVEVLVRQLGDPKFAVRDAADRKLRTLGEPVLPRLREAAGFPCLETQTRSKRLIEAIILGASKSKSLGMQMVLIPAGEFEMGSPPREPGRQPEEAMHAARLTRPFLLGTFEVTQAEYETVMKRRPSWFTGDAEKTRGMDTRHFPVERVSWYSAVEFCNKLSALDGYPAYYRIDEEKRADGMLRSANVTIAGGNGYRLPTETEWEYACRAKTTTAYHFGVRLKEGQANTRIVVAIGYGTRTDSLGRTAKVGTYPPNGWGLHDMHGNVAEWCWDWRDINGYAKAPLEDSHGPAEGIHRVLRGGSWIVNMENCRSASRFWQMPGEASYFAGFRVARTP